MWMTININGSRSWDLQLLMFGYITCGFPRIFGYVLQVIKYSVSVPLDRGGFGGWNLMLTRRMGDEEKSEIGVVSGERNIIPHIKTYQL